MLKFGNVLPLRNWDICRNVILQRSWPWKVKVIGQNKWHQQLPWLQKHRSRHQNLHPKCFSSKVIVKDIFLHNGGQRNAFVYVTRSNRPRYFFHLLKGLNPSYLVLKFGNILPINNWDVAQNVISQRSWLWKVKVIGQNKWHHQIPWPWKHISRCQNRHPKCLSSKVMVKDVFLHNGGQRNTFAYVSRSNRSGCFFDLLKGPDPSYSVLKFGDNLSSRNRDMAQSVILYSCHLERSRSSVRSIIFCTAILTLPIGIYIKFRWNRIAGCLDTVA